MNTNAKLQKIKQQLGIAIKNPLLVDLTELGTSVISIFSKEAKFYEITPTGFKFIIKNICFRITFTQDKYQIVLQYRHPEAIEWKNGKFNPRKKNKLKELLDKIQIILNKKITPFD